MDLKKYIIADNENFIVINKPPGLLTIPDRVGKEPSLKGLLQQQAGEIFTVHRLDRETSGVVVFAKNAATHKELSRIFEERDVAKYYLGLVMGKPAVTEGTIEAGIMEHPVKKGTMAINKKGKPSVTEYEVLENFRYFSWMQFRIHTGRTHQIRVHMKHLGHPIVCDPLYGDGKPVLLSSIKHRYHLSKTEVEERPILSRLALHSWKLQFTLMQHSFAFEAGLPKDLRALLQQLRKNNA